ncbi:MAG: glycosyltransferase [Spirochaetia bacterium]
MISALVKNSLRPLYSKVFALRVNISSLYTTVPSLGQKIPNVVYQTWKTPVLSLRHAWAVRRFRRMNREYSFRFFDDDQMSAYMNLRYSGHPILKIFNDIQVPASKVDVWRYCILYREGGIYCDIDSALKTPFRELLRDDPQELISFEGSKWSEGNGFDRVTYSDPALFLPAPSDGVRMKLECPDHTVLNWLLCFEKESPILAEVIDLIVRHADFFRGKKFASILHAVTHFSGPHALTQAVWKSVEKTGRRPAQCGIDFCGQGVFKLPGEENRYRDSPHYTELPRSTIL